MRIFSNRVVWGLLLVGGGTIFLLQNLGILPQSPSLWGTTALIVGVFFLLGFFVNQEYWWAAIPAFTLLGVAMVTFWDQLPIRGSYDEMSGAALLGVIALGFIAVLLRASRNWWAIIPAGVLLSLAGILALQIMVRNPGPMETGGVLFLGLGVTFLLVLILPSPDGRRRWAFWPAIILIFLGLLMSAAATDLLNVLWPVALILGGLLVLLRGLCRR